MTFGGDSSQKELVTIVTTNVGERPVTIDVIGWCIGKGKRKQQFIQMISSVLSDQLPKKIAHGETASFRISLSDSPEWFEVFAKNFIDENYMHKVETLRAQIHTSVGHTEDVTPERSFLDRLDTTIANLQNN